MSDEAQALEFDTRGWVTRFGADDPRFVDTRIHWADLEPSVQGYVIEAAKSAGLVRFTRFTPAALAQIIEHCAEQVRLGAPNTAESGATLFRGRQNN